MEPVPFNTAKVGEGAVELMAKPAIEIGVELGIGIVDGGQDFSPDEWRDGEILAVVESARQEKRVAGKAPVVIKSEGEGDEKPSGDGKNDGAERQRLNGQTSWQMSPISYRLNDRQTKKHHGLTRCQEYDMS